MMDSFDDLREQFIKIKNKHLLKLNSSLGNDVENLYHYTSLESCLKILETGSLHFTDARFCNDPEEIINGIEIFKNVHDNQRKELPASNFINTMNKILSCLINYFSLQTKDIPVPTDIYQKLQTSIFLCCFSNLNDDLAQWISYGDNGKGVCIKFRGVKNTHQLVYDATIIKASYASKEAKEKYTRDMYLEIKDIYPENDTIELFRELLETYVEDMVASKSSYYEKEGEWRLYQVTNIDDNLEKINFKFSNGLIKPYISCPILENAILEIKLGPKAEKDLNYHSLNQILKKYKYNNVVITHSSIKYR